MKDAVCLIPARLNSTRFPRKVLADLCGKPLIRHVYEAASLCGFSDIVIAVDHKETFDLVTSFGARAVMTSTECQSGTDRLVEVVKRGELRGDRFVNWQGDEPFVCPDMINNLLEGEGDVWTLKKEISEYEELHSPHVVKVVTDQAGYALYFSRSLIPYQAKVAYKHIGIYGYSREALSKIAVMKRSHLEVTESLEQLRFLDHGLKIKVNETSFSSLGIDTPEDLERAKKHIVLA